MNRHTVLFMSLLTFIFISSLSAEETVSTPDTPTGPASGYITLGYTLTTGGSVSSEGHTVQYRFDWGDGTTTAWSTATSVTKTFTVGGTRVVKAQARCQTDTSVISEWSEGLSVVIQQCQFYNLTRKCLAMTDNMVNTTDVSAIISYLNVYRIATSVWAVYPPSENYDPCYNLSTASSAINASDVSALITYINNHRISADIWVANCNTNP